MDGAFDMMHYGHMNAFRKGRAMGTTLVVGVNSDESVTQCKGAPVMNDAVWGAHPHTKPTSISLYFPLIFLTYIGTDGHGQRMQICGWGSTLLSLVFFYITLSPSLFSQVVPNVPYVMNDKYLKWVIEEYRIDYVVHGDDPCIVDGRDVYESAQKMGEKTPKLTPTPPSLPHLFGARINTLLSLSGKYLTIPRTEGISTTDIVGRMLLMTRNHHSASFRYTCTRTNTYTDQSTCVCLCVCFYLMYTHLDRDTLSDSWSEYPQSLSPLSSFISGENSEDESDPEQVTRQLAVRNVDTRAEREREEAVIGFDRKSDFFTTSHVIRLFGAGSKVMVKEGVGG
jgi:cytidyltransferase-like protein